MRTKNLQFMQLIRALRSGSWGDWRAAWPTMQDGVPQGWCVQLIENPLAT